MPEPSIQYMDKTIERAVKLHDKGVPFDQYPDDLKEIFHRWSVAHEIRIKYQFKGEEFVRGFHKARFKLNDTTARQDLRCAAMFFGKITNTNRNYERILAQERLKMAINEAYAEKDWKAVQGLESVLQKYLDPANDPPERLDWEELRQSVQPTIQYNPELQGVKRMSSEDVMKLWKSVQSRKNSTFEEADIILDEPTTSISKIEEENA
jgi:hypothetical protein